MTKCERCSYARQTCRFYSMHSYTLITKHWEECAIKVPCENCGKPVHKREECVGDYCGDYKPKVGLWRRLWGR